MDVSVRTGSISELADGWSALWERDPSASLFQRPEYLGVWLPEFGGDRAPAVVEVRDGGELIGLAPLSVDPDGVLRFLGDPDVTDYFGPVAGPAEREAVATAMMDAAAGIDGWETAELAGLAGDSGWAELLARAAKAAGFQVEESQQDVCPRVALRGGHGAYLAALDAKRRHEIKRKARKLEREAGRYAVRVARSDRLHEELERFFEMHRTSEGHKGHFLHWGMAGFFILLARTFDERGWLRLVFLEVDGEPVAGALAFSARGVWSVYNSAYDQRRAELAPGMVLTGETIRLAAEEGCHTFDLLRGDEPYKYRFGATDVPLQRLTARRG